VRLTNNPPAVAEDASNWSPAGKEYGFIQQLGGKADLAKVRTGSNSAHVVLKTSLLGFSTGLVANRRMDHL
jgi:hypothetical protein